MPAFQKNLLIKTLSLFLALVLLASLPTSASALTYLWLPQTLDSAEYVGMYTSLAVVNGNPAISYYDEDNDNLKFIRANDLNGTTWSTQILDSTGRVGTYTSLAVVNGNPAVSYFDSSNSDLKFIRANDANGTTWGTPQTLDSAGTVGMFTSLAVVNGNPAISYYDPSDYDLKFIRANDANGTTWGTPQSLDSAGNVGLGTSLAVVNGNPAVSYFDYSNSDLKFISANDANGTTWGTPQPLDSAGDVGQYNSLEIANGNPAISYYDASNDDLKFIRANDASGTSWAIPQVLDSPGSVGMYTSLAIVNGNPAISYCDASNDDLKFIRANDTNGTSWGTPQSLDSAETVGLFSSLAIMNGNPGISYYDFANSALKFIYYQGTIDLALVETGNPINSGSTLNFGSTTLNNPITKTLTLQNNGNLALDLNSFSLPDGFSLTGSYDTSIPAGSSKDIHVSLNAHSTGIFSGSLTIQNQDTENSPYTITLGGTVSPSMLTAPLLSPVSGSTILNSPIQVAFNQPVKSDRSPEAANNPANYLLMEAGSNGVFDTVTCAVGVSGDDVEISIGSIAYESTTYVATLNPDPLPTGRYQLLVCGTASIEGLSGNVLNNGIYDSSTFFTVISNESNQDSGGSATNLPTTGFTPDQFTHLPIQPESKEYSDIPNLSLEIPGLALNLPIVGVPQTANGWDVTWLNNAQIGWLNGSAFPTWAGNTVLTGHVTNTSGQPGAFADLQLMKYGETVILRAYGQTCTYEVRENVLVLPNNLDSVMQSRDHDWVTLMTCEYFNELSGEYLFRRVVRAVLVGVE